MSIESKPVLPKNNDRDQFLDYQHPDDASFDKFVKALDKAYHRPWLMFGRAILFGMGYALGATVGVALVFTALFYVLRTIDFVPHIEGLQNLIIPEEIRDQLDKNDDFQDQKNQAEIKQ